jgi:lipoprotein-anchoring transpeptidase ErfK/SrfK
VRVAVVTLCAAVLAAPAAAGPAHTPQSWPAAGELVVPQVFARRAPDLHARVVRVLGQFRSDFRPRVVLALEDRIAPGGSRWYRISLPGRPNGGRGWVPAEAVRVSSVANRIVVHRAARTLEVRRVADRRLLFSAPIAVGAPDAPTPLGRNFYVQWGFAPTDPFYGPFALETSAYSRLSDWPGGGVVGIHGTSLPQLIGQAVSHGCIRMRNEDVVRLRRLAPVGTPLDIVR